MSTRPTILVAGAINTDLVATMHAAPGPGETITGTSFAIHGGGKGANQAVAAARSGASVAMLGAIGPDEFGSARLSALADEGIHTGWIQHSTTHASGVALIFVEETGENRIAFVPGATSGIEPGHCLEALGDLHPPLLLATNELPLHSLSALFQRAHHEGIRIILNATPDPALARELIPWSDVVVLNAGEATQILGYAGDLDPVRAIAELRFLGPSSAILTLGPDGVIGNDEDQIFSHRPPVVEVVDTTGAGDTFCGAFVAALAEGESVTSAARFGVTASALSVSKSGAQSSIPTRDEVVRSLAAG